MLVEIDNREKNQRIKSAVKFYTDLEWNKNQLQYKGNGNTVNIETLAVGDYVFDKRVCFEYKTSPDIIGSIMDGRVFKQVERMQQYDKNFVIIVGDVSEEINQRNYTNYWNKYGKLKQFTIKSYLGAVARLSQQTNVLHVKNQQQAFYLMQSIVEKVGKNVKKVDKPSFKLTDPIASFLGCIYVNDTTRISSKTAVSIREYLHLETLDDLLGIERKDLLKVNGVGKQTADAIIKVLR